MGRLLGRPVQKGLQNACEGKIVALGTARGKEDLFGGAMQKRRDGAPGTFHGRPRRLAAPMR